MERLRVFLQRHSLGAGLALMFLLTWPIDLANSGVLPFQVPFAVYIMLGWGFIAASILITGLTGGRKAVVALLRRFLIWRVRFKWYLVALLLLPAIYTAAVAFDAIVRQSPVDFSTVFAHQIFGPSANLPVLVLPFFLFDAITNGEEMGWRGYVLPRLQARHGALVASLILGLIWGVWHLPKYLSPDNESSFNLFMVRIVPEAVLYTWLYNNTRGSLLLITLFHASGNTAGVFLPIANTASTGRPDIVVFVIVLQTLTAILVVGFQGHRELSRLRPRQIHA